MLPIPPDTLLQQRYRILNMLGEGGFGRTYLAIDIARTAVAGRTPADEYCEIQEFIPGTQFPTAVTKAKEFFKQEAILLYQIQHSQVPRFWATFEEQGRLFIVLDYVEGKTFGQILDQRRATGAVFSEAEVWRLLIQILPALGYIHSKGVVHRDLSPDNIILRDRDRLPVLSDFGAVREFADRLQANSSDLSHSVILGKPGYAPVEQLVGGQIYPNSDLYALAVTAIVLLTGKEPSALFEGNLINGDWRKWTQITDGLANVLQRMLSPHPNERYQAAIEVYRDLQSLDIANNQLSASLPPEPIRPLAIPPTPVADHLNSTDSSRTKTAITYLNAKSIWEKPQVFIPLGILISLLAGLGSWFAVTEFLHNRSSEPVASTPPKKIDFNNPTVSNDRSPNVTTNVDTIQPALNRAVIKEGTVDAAAPMRYKIAAISGQNLDIQLLPLASSIGAATKSPLPTNGTQSSPDASSAVSPIASIPSTNPTDRSTNKIASPTQTSSPSAATQVLMSVLSPTGVPVDAQADRVVGWRGQITTAGDYTIELRPIAGLTGTAFPYQLSVTQLTAIPSPLPSSESITPATGSTPPLAIPVPIGGNGLDPKPSSSPTTTSPSDSIPTITPSPVPSETPKASSNSSQTASEQPTRRRRRVRREVEPSPQVRQRRRVESSNEQTATSRRRRRIESSNEAAATLRRRRRNRVTTTETQPKQTRSTTLDAGNNSESSNPPKQEPIFVPSPKPEPIAVPTPKNSSAPPSKTNGGSTNQTSGNGSSDPG